ncbi:glycosyltransferase family A protein [Faecalimonas umbilicata]|uniref:glycosyltransferase family A protein n=1 Tax=Faecalimonas umbilicata TaxID=1912855 RepID=UPI0022E1278F|nr:glycosyltransferase family A protein [Faecalimonas umbilicata]
MTKGLVSIITPCYNMEKYIERMMNSVIAQTYRPIEFILVDDGSTDTSYSLAEGYKEKFALAGISYTLFHQENKGLGGAINAGLNFVSGEYICWPDADDYLEPTSVEEKVTAFKLHPDCAVVTSNAYIRKASNLEEKKWMITEDLKKHSEPKQFFYLLNEESVFCSGCHMVRSQILFEVNPDYCIYPARRGQNWQMLLPVYYKHKRYFLNKPLYNYIVYPNSMSHGDEEYEKMLYRFNEHEQILKEVLKKIEKVQNADLTEYNRFIGNKYAKLRMELAIQFQKKEDYVKEYKRKKLSIGLDLLDRFVYIKNKMPCLKYPISAVCKVIRLLERRMYKKKYLQ